MNKGLLNIILVCIGLIVLYYIAQTLFAEHSIPSFGDIVASSTVMLSDTIGTSTSAEKKPSAFQKLFQSIASSSTATKSTVHSDIKLLPTTSLITSKGSVKAFVAHTDMAREQGLSGQASLPNGVGMLFAYDTPGKYGFWMKDMNFPLDFVWIDSQKHVAGVTKNVLASSYPFVFMPPSDIQYVLEINAGTFSSFGLTTGSSVQFSLP